MTKKFKLLLMSAGSAVALGAPVLFAASCTKVVPAYEKGEFVTEYNAAYQPSAFTYDGSRSYGQMQEGIFTYLTSGELFRTKAVSQAINSTVSVSKGGSTVEAKTVTTKPTVAKYVLGLAKAVVITDASGQTTVFDSDDAEDKIADPDQELTDASGQKVKYYSNSNYYLTSNNKKSINSLAFTTALKSAKKLQIVLKKGIKWTDNEGNKTQYEVVPKDFFYSWIRTVTMNQDQRWELGGSKSLDELFQTVISTLSNIVFSENERYSNEYLYKVFGIDSSKFYKENEFITNVADTVQGYANEQAITFTGSEHGDAKFDEFLKTTLLVGDLTLLPAPSQFIDAMNEKQTQPLYQDNGEVLDLNQASRFRAKLNSLDKESLVYKAGVYWYGASIKNTLFSGAYYPQGRKGISDSYLKNPNYWDTEWVNAKNTINKITELYQQKPVDAKEFSNTLFNKYSQGLVSQLNYSLLSEGQQKTVSENAANYGYRLFKRLNKDNPYYFFVQTPFVNNQLTEFGYNDNYAKLVYGSSIEDLKADKQKRDNYISGLGLSFRSILNTAINWNTLISEASNGQAAAWVAKVADGSQVGGSDQATSPIKTPGNVADVINSLSAIDKDGNKIDFGEALGKEISPSENDAYNSDKSTTTDKLKSAGWTILQTKMQELLDAFYAANPGSKEADNGEIRFSYFYPYNNPSDKSIAVWKKLEEVFQALNPKLKLDIKYFTNTTVPEDKKKFDAWRMNGVNGYKVIAWSYDYNSIGSGYDGLSWSGSLIPMLVNISRLEESSKFAQAFPSIYSLAKDLIKYEKTHEFVSSIPFNELDKASGYYYTIGITRVFSRKVEKDEETGTYKLVRVSKDGEKVTVPFVPEEGKQLTDPWEWSSIFWLNYVGSKTNEELKTLMQELSSFLDVNFVTGIGKQKEEFIKQLINKNYVTPRLSGWAATPYQDWSIEKK
ncbi:OppA family ABC transporter substrate-binding lipoprotein [Metamycoplasma neophronis]|uniref:Oligopeptide ABC transporter substrate-binding protein n=1 Tax=Metamycoplasma neophronis TaxID=872983 RepID=A0ABY2Z1C0_9BACT|nr:oligopeptide ABC transporter substrate-binding protein [Metamycoplasma neophronis]TPR53271.1 oligopeptide ABC transporter substrate-binding protein [Metamycoplasma neophronis]